MCKPNDGIYPIYGSLQMAEGQRSSTTPAPAVSSGALPASNGWNRPEPWENDSVVTQ